MTISVSSHSLIKNAVKRGIGRISAVGEIITTTTTTPNNASNTNTNNTNNNKSKTRLTQVSHEAPTRLIPIKSSLVDKAGAALVALSSYGGGMLQGDTSNLHINVNNNATLGVITQGSNRIYKSKSNSISTNSMISASRSPTHNNNNKIKEEEEEKKQQEETCRSILKAKIGTNSLLVLAPDPCIPFKDSSFVQHQEFDLQDDASVVLIDWYGAGRLSSGERWDFRHLSSRSFLYNNDDGKDKKSKLPFLIESFSLDQRKNQNVGVDAIGSTSSTSTSNSDPFGFDVAKFSDIQCNAFCSVILHGPKAKVVSERCKSLEAQLLSQYTTIRNIRNNDDYDSEEEEEEEEKRSEESMQLLDLSSLSGRVLLGVSEVHHTEGSNKITSGSNDTVVARFAATTNEDIYRALHWCLHPLHEQFGIEFYRERIQASSSASVMPPSVVQTVADGKVATTINNNNNNLSSNNKKRQESQKDNNYYNQSAATWRALMLADSGLPTGGFAHSSGIEAASQLGLFRTSSAIKETNSDNADATSEAVSAYILASTRSTTQLLTPFIYAGHDLVNTMDNDQDRIYKDWCYLDGYNHALIVSNEPSCRASMDQGQGLLRVSRKWLDANKIDAASSAISGKPLNILDTISKSISKSPKRYGHIGPIFGIVGGLLDIPKNDVSRVLGYCVARDMVSAAVRLNLIGPLASVSILDNAWYIVDDGIEAAMTRRPASFKNDEAVLNGYDIEKFVQSGQHFNELMNAATCSPVVDTIHPCHDLLSVRLFRT